MDSRVFHDAASDGGRNHLSGFLVISTAATHSSEPGGIARLREQVAERDEIIVALQHVIGDLRHEVENLHAENAYAAFALRRRRGSSPR